MGKKVFYVIIAIAVLVALYYLVGLNKQTNEGLTPGDSLPMEQEFESKIVYTIDVSLSPGPFRADCETRDGVFNECGTICEPDAEICAEVCAYTCDLSGEDVVDEAATSTDQESGTSTEEIE